MLLELVFAWNCMHYIGAQATFSSTEGSVSPESWVVTLWQSGLLVVWCGLFFFDFFFFVLFE